jgi:uncharacterized membrane protein
MAVKFSSDMIDEKTAVPGKAITGRLKAHWFLLFLIMMAVYVSLPWLAPVFMEMGWAKAANAIYLIYQTQCHQMPQRSFFLFGDSPMYSLMEVQSVWQNSANPLVLRQFTGNSEMGWKVAWSDRMVFMYSSIILWGIIFFRPLRKGLQPLSWWGFVLLSLPLVIDGGTHFFSDIVGGIGGGFRYSNIWLARLTNYTFPATFYAGDALGSFNSWMRLVTGILFALGIVWFIFPYLQRSFDHE